MEATAKLSYLRITPRKVRVVADLIRGKQVGQALNMLTYVEKRAAESDGVASDGEGLRENERRIEQALGLRGGELCAEVHPGSGVDGAVEGGVFEFEATAIPDQRDEKNSRRQKLLRAGENGAGMRGNFRRKAAQSGGDEVR